jgi:hypothetical protein
MPRIRPPHLIARDEPTYDTCIGQRTIELHLNYAGCSDNKLPVTDKGA